MAKRTSVRRARGRSILVCPQCGSPRINLIAGALLGQVYRCTACDYVGSLVLEQDVPTEPPSSDGT